MIIGFPSNIAIIWLHTRKRSQVAKNKFPLIFAMIDLIAITALPVRIFQDFSKARWLDQLFSDVSLFVFAFAMKGYLLALLMATVDKFYAVFYPFKYRSKQKIFFKIALFPSFGWSLAFASILRIRIGWLIFYRRYIFGAYSVFILLILLTTISLYVCIVIKLIHAHKLQVAKSSAMRWVSLCLSLTFFIEPAMWQLFSIIHLYNNTTSPVFLQVYYTSRNTVFLFI